MTALKEPTLPASRFEERHPADVPVQLPDTRNRTDPSYLQQYHSEFCPDIAKNGVMVPLILALILGVEVLLDGETRRRAALEVGLKKVPVLILDGPVDPKDLELIKYRLNRKRRALSPMEEARFLHGAMKAKGWTLTRLCRELDLNPPTVSRNFKVIEKLCDKLKEKLGEGPGMLSWRGAYAICDLSPDQQERWADELLGDRMCIEDVERAIKGKKVSQKKVVHRQKHTMVVLKTDDQAGAIAELSGVIESLKRKKAV